MFAKYCSTTRRRLRPVGSPGESSLARVSKYQTEHQPKPAIPRMRIRNIRNIVDAVCAVVVRASIGCRCRRARRPGRYPSLGRQLPRLSLTRRDGALASIADSAVYRGCMRGPVKVASPSRRRSAVVDALDVLGGASPTDRAVAVTLGLGEATGGAGAICAYFPQRRGRRLLGRGRPVISDAV